MRVTPLVIWTSPDHAMYHLVVLGCRFSQVFHPAGGAHGALPTLASNAHSIFPPATVSTPHRPESLPLRYSVNRVLAT